MKLIPIYNRYKELLCEVQVDDDDYEYLTQFKWHSTYKNVSENEVMYYARRSHINNGKEIGIYMHREIMGVTDPNIFVDHIDCNPINNQKSNLRTCTRSQNVINSKSTGKSKYKGVIYNKVNNGKGKEYEYWEAFIKIKNSKNKRRNFPFNENGEKMAAIQYNEWAKVYHGEFAHLNNVNCEKRYITFSKPKKEAYLGKDKIKIGNNLYTLIDESDYDILSKYHWHFDKQKTGSGYAVSRLSNGKRIYMHRLLTNCPDNMIVDHIDGNKLNNRKSNLRICTPKQNSQNRRSNKTSNSKYLGVSKCKRNHIYKGKTTIYYYYRATIKANNKKLTIFNTKATPCGEILAAIKYDEAAEKYFGEFANLNFKPLW